jgi:anti-sigma regulatory factor (Ser/Thr protein kinase)
MSATDRFARVIEPDMDQLALLRQELGRWLADRGAGGSAVADVVLVATELSTNAIDANPAARVDVAAAADDDQVVLTVTNAASRPFRLDGPVAPAEPTGRRGRGLYLAQELSDGLTVEHADGRTTATATFDDLLAPGRGG